MNERVTGFDLCFNRVLLTTLLKRGSRRTEARRVIRERVIQVQDDGSIDQGRGGWVVRSVIGF